MHKNSVSCNGERSSGVLSWDSWLSTEGVRVFERGGRGVDREFFVDGMIDTRLNMVAMELRIVYEHFKAHLEVPIEGVFILKIRCEVRTYWKIAQ